MTIDELREAVREALAAKTTSEGPCPRCRGVGTVLMSRPVITQSELAERIGAPRTSVSAFLSGRQGFTMPVTLRLLEWLSLKDDAFTDQSAPLLARLAALDEEKPHAG